MDRPEGKSEDGDFDQNNSDAVSESGDSAEDLGGRTEASNRTESDMKEPPTWKHDQKISFDQMAEYLKTIKERVEAVKDAEKLKLQRMVGVRDSIRKR